MSHLLDPRQRAEALGLIRALSMVAGNEQQVANVLAAYGQEAGVTRATNTSLAALVITYGACMAQPVPLNIPNEGDQP